MRWEETIDLPGLAGDRGGGEASALPSAEERNECTAERNEAERGCCGSSS